MYICLDCGHLFDVPAEWYETHGFSSPPYEHWSGCPRCNGAYVDAFKCDGCDEWIVDDYIKADDHRYCQDCYSYVELGSE